MVNALDHEKSDSECTVETHQTAAACPPSGKNNKSSINVGLKVKQKRFNTMSCTEF